MSIETVPANSKVNSWENGPQALFIGRTSAMLRHALVPRRTVRSPASHSRKRNCTPLYALFFGIVAVMSMLPMPAGAQYDWYAPCQCNIDPSQFLQHPGYMGNFVTTPDGIFTGNAPTLYADGGPDPYGSIYGSPIGCSPTSATASAGGAWSCVRPNCTADQPLALNSGAVPITVSVTCTGNSCVPGPPDAQGFPTQICTPASANASKKFTVDATPPMVTLDKAPPDNSIIGLAPITLSGSITSISQSTITLDGSVDFSVPFSSAIIFGGRPPLTTLVSNAGGSWQIIVGSSSLLALAQNVYGTGGESYGLTNSSGLTTLGIYATDAVGLTESYSSATFPAFNVPTFTVQPKDIDTVSSSLARQVYIDYMPPVVTFSPGSVGNITSLSVTSGTITDNLRLGTLSISIQELNPTHGPKYWSDTNLAWSNNPEQIPITINSGPNLTSSSPPGVTFSSWTYNRLTDDNLVIGKTYVLSAFAADYAGNVSTTTSQFLLISHGPYSNLNAVLLNTGGAVAFNPPQPAVTWGGFDTVSITVTLNNGLTPDQVTFNNDDGFLIVAWNGLTATVRSNPSSCSRSGQINVYDNKGSVIAAVKVKILAPTSTTATMSEPYFHNLGAGRYPAIECDAVDTRPPCRGDRWAPIFFNGDNAMNLTSLQQIEDQSQYQPLPPSAQGRLPLCPIGAYNFADGPGDPPFQNPMGSTHDAMSYHWLNTPLSIKAFKNCGDSSTQSFNFISNYTGNGVAGTHRCTFITGIQKTKQLNFQQNICTTRSDGVPNASCQRP